MDMNFFLYFVNIFVFSTLMWGFHHVIDMPEEHFLDHFVCLDQGNSVLHSNSSWQIDFIQKNVSFFFQTIFRTVGHFSEGVRISVTYGIFWPKLTDIKVAPVSAEWNYYRNVYLKHGFEPKKWVKMYCWVSRFFSFFWQFYWILSDFHRIFWIFF